MNITRNLALPVKISNPPDLPKGTHSHQKRDPKGGPFWVLGDARAPKLAEPLPLPNLPKGPIPSKKRGSGFWVMQEPQN